MRQTKGGLLMYERPIDKHGQDMPELADSPGPDCRQIVKGCKRRGWTGPEASRSLVSVLISLAAVSSYINYRYIRLPTPVGVMLVALVASLTLILVGPYAGGVREQATTLFSQIELNQVALHGVLAFLLFAGSIHADLDELGRKWLTV